MKREFLQNLQMAGEPLSKEVIDAIMEANGRDIEKAKAGFADYEQVKEELAQTRQQLQTLQQMDYQGLQDAARQWEEKYNTAQQTHLQELRNLRFEHLLHNAITAAKGRNAKAITALLDVEALKMCEDPQQAALDAVAQLKKESGYLFEAEITPPLYARGTGSQMGTEENQPTTLAGALKEKFERK